VEADGYHPLEMADAGTATTSQLSLRLEPALPNPPANLRPMLARPLPEAFDSASHLFEPWWGGVRALAVIAPGHAAGSGDVSLLDESGKTFPRVPPDLAGLAVRVAARSAVMDGELVVVDASGHLDPDELERRLAGKPGRPLAYLAFDLIDLDGRSLLSMPLERRRELLRRTLRAGDELVAVPAIAQEGRALFDAVASQGLAGIRARQRTSPYLPGVRSRLWRTVAVGRARQTRRGADEVLDGLAIEQQPRAATVLALIRRLPLGLDDEPLDAGASGDA
jgi:bifunctional non-homologous end joining protein LigD